MGERGPLAALRVVGDDEVRGNPSKRPPRQFVRARPAIPDPPARLSREARAEWRRVTVELHELGLLSRLDRAVLALYCTWWARWRELERLVGDGYLQERGTKTPMWSQLKDASDRVERLAKTLLCDPTSRLRAAVPEGASDDDPLDDILD